ncbi:THUMP-like domain-containing protein [Allomuricauda sp. F6463D]|uniref:THUMP-like domain-containing protein n=1 Tax=Allomuricauda sp. F6463D TaxID=2926409 RepID=UPI00293F49C3|nr:class I SAM-dependent methyltransferase [Muricauda sp. F6463D]
MSVLLAKPIFEGISQKELVEQVEAKKKCESKLPTWFGTSNIYYPNKLNIEQTSSEITAKYKAQLASGKSLVDLTGGFGVDSYFFSKKIATVWHCEINTKLSEIVAYNFTVLKQNNIKCIPEDGIVFLKNSTQHFDWIYVDPSRRNDIKGKVFLLEDCLPNLPEHLPLMFEKSQNILIKTSPLLDIKKGISELRSVKEIHVVAINNEVKELLFILKKEYSGNIKITTTNIRPKENDDFSFILEEEQLTNIEFGPPNAFLFEPNAAILKSGGFKSVAKAYGVKKLHLHSHLYTCDHLIDFPGRRFKIEHTLPYSKKTIKSTGITKANITVRNFPLSVSELRKKHKIKDGGDQYLFLTKDLNDKLIVLICLKV